MAKKIIPLTSSFSCSNSLRIEWSEMNFWRLCCWIGALPDYSDVEFDHIRDVLSDNGIWSIPADTFKAFIEILTQSVQIETRTHEEAQMGPCRDAVNVNWKENQNPANNVSMQGMRIQRCAERAKGISVTSFPFSNSCSKLPHQIHGIPSGRVTVGRYHSEENGVHRCDDQNRIIIEEKQNERPLAVDVCFSFRFLVNCRSIPTELDTYSRREI